MVHEIVTVGNEILHTTCKTVENIDEVKDLIEDLKETLLAHNENGLGLAAPQIGVDKRVLVMKEGLESRVTPLRMKNIFAMINPEIIKKYPKTGIYMEGCMSIPNKVMHVERCREIKVRYMDESGRVVTQRFTGIDAVVAQHEIDHLKGVLACDEERALQVFDTTPKPKDSEQAAEEVAPTTEEQVAD